MLPNITGVEFIFGADSLDGIAVEIRERYGVREVDTTLVLLSERDVRSLLIESNAKTVEFLLDNVLVRQRLQRIETDQNQIASLCRRNNLSTTTFAIFGTFNNT